MFRSILARVGLLLLAIGGLTSCAAEQPRPAQQAQTDLPFSECRLTAAEAAVSVIARCTTIAVPENHAEPTGAAITLNVTVIPALSRNTQTDPLVLIAGGPGQAAGSAFTPLLNSLRDIRQTRDLILVDQRGTGGSTPLACPDAPLETDTAEALAAWTRTCLDTIAYDPTQFTTEAAVRDLELVRAALRYEQLNILGVSYGTRVAQHYARRFPERTRSLVLDGVVRPELAIGAEFAADGQRALDRMFDRCADDPACAGAFPNLRADLSRLLAELEAAPMTVQLADPLTGAPTELTLDRQLAAITILNLTYAPETTALLPLLIQTAAEGDLRPLAAQSLLITRQALATINLGMRLSVICAEDAPHFPATAPDATSYLGTSVVEQLSASCALWPADPAPADLRTPLQSAIPALLLSGEADPVTPPINGDAVVAGLPNGVHIVAPGQGHNIFFRGCVPRLIAGFLDAGSAAGLDVGCVERLTPTPFFTGFNGPAG
jgi:pimeloyl-ACP methyl ester carboxylesterase